MIESSISVYPSSGEETDHITELTRFDSKVVGLKKSLKVFDYDRHLK